MRIRRNSRLQVWNSVFAGFGRGLRIQSENGWAAAQSDSLTVQHSLLAGIRNVYFKTDVADGVSAVRSWYLDAARSNDTLVAAADLMLEDPFNYTARNFMPKAESPLLTGSYWYEPTGIGRDEIGSATLVKNYPNPFRGITHIDITLDQSTPVEVQVYDLTGKRVADLYKGVMTPGKNSLTFNVESLGKGVYIGIVKTSKEEMVFKMIAQ
jgi:hypothetical protein